MVLTLYKIDGSPPVRAVYMTIEALGLHDVQYQEVNLMEGEHMKEEFVKINPQHTVPMLKDGDFYVWDSHAIASYLVTVYGKDDALYPADPKKRALIDQRLHFDSGILFPALRGSVEPIFFFGESSFRPENLEKIKKAYELSEKFLTDQFMVGNDVTLADICCISSLSTMNEILPIDPEQYPNLVSWLDRCSKLDFYKKGNIAGLMKFRELLKLKLGDSW